MRIASYNIRKAVGLDYKRDPARILRVIEALNPDVIAIQEADKRLGDRPTALHHNIYTDAGYKSAEVAINDVSVGWHGNAMLVRENLNIASAERLDLPGLEPRGAIRVSIETPRRHIHVIGAHLGLLRKYRREQLKMISDHIPDGDDAHTLILGDFNEWGKNLPETSLNERFTVANPGKSFHAKLPLAALDRVVYGSAITIDEIGVWMEGEARIASDHMPIYADIQIAPD